MHSRTWTTIITTVALAVTLATTSIGLCRMIIPGTRPTNDILALPTGGGGGVDCHQSSQDTRHASPL